MKLITDQQVTSKTFNVFLAKLYTVDTSTAEKKKIQIFIYLFIFLLELLRASSLGLREFRYDLFLSVMSESLDIT